MLTSGNEQAIVDTLLSLALYDPDWKWVQDNCLAHADANVRWNAAILDTEVVVPTLLSLKNDESIEAAIEDALEDIRHFIRTN